MISRFFATSFLVLVFIYLFLLRFDAVRDRFTEGQTLRIEGEISDEPIQDGGRQNISIGQFKFYTERFPEYKYGEKIAVEGIVAKGRSGWYLKSARIISPTPVKTASGPKYLLLALREKVLSLYSEYFPEPHRSLIAGMILGTKSSLDFQFFEALRKTSTLHVVVASGTNISFFGGGILFCLAPLVGRKKALAVSLIGIFSYVVLVGFQPPIVRAAIMGVVAFSAQVLGREARAWRALVGAAAIMLLINPLWLLDLGFQLSFLATGGILAFSGRFREIFNGKEDKGDKRKVRTRITRVRLLTRFVPRVFADSFSTTLAAQIAVSPLLYLKLGQFSPVSLLVNTLVLWTIPFIMLGGVLVAFTGLIWKPLGQLIAWFVWLPLEYFVRVVEGMGGVY